ncbi:hypothetical protein [Desulfoluna spongiiphila]|uniref:hypothetical protein n=1 Tax=Desulfoluna spongiiphila TaxID=419481 RepID=UPI0015870293|nr:hypothetical protein [Desulfoluna spongiiphila]
MGKRSSQAKLMLLQMVIQANSDISKVQNVIRRFLLDFLTLRASRVHPSSALSEP